MRHLFLPCQNMILVLLEWYKPHEYREWVFLECMLPFIPMIVDLILRIGVIKMTSPHDLHTTIRTLIVSSQLDTLPRFIHNVLRTIFPATTW